VSVPFSARALAREAEGEMSLNYTYAMPSTPSTMNEAHLTS